MRKRLFLSSFRSSYFFLDFLFPALSLIPVNLETCVSFFLLPREERGREGKDLDGFFLFLNLNERGFAVFGRFASGNTRVLCECGFVTRIRHARREIVAVFMSCASADDASRQTRRIARFFFSFFFFYDVLETNLSFFEARSCRFTR